MATALAVNGAKVSSNLRYDVPIPSTLVHCRCTPHMHRSLYHTDLRSLSADAVSSRSKRLPTSSTERPKNLRMAERSWQFKLTSAPRVVLPSSTTSARRSSTRLVQAMLLSTVSAGQDVGLKVAHFRMSFVLVRPELSSIVVRSMVKPLPRAMS